MSMGRSLPFMEQFLQLYLLPRTRSLCSASQQFRTGFGKRHVITRDTRAP